MTDARHGISRIAGATNPLVEWIARLGGANILWVLLTFAGLVVGGIFPATAALYVIVRRWFVHPETQGEPFAREMVREWRRHMGSANLLGWIVTLISGVIAYELWLTIGMAGSVWAAVFYGSVIVAAMYCAMLLHLPFVAAHVEVRGLRLIRASWMLALAQPFTTLAIAALIVGLSYAQGAWPALVLVASASPIAFLTTVLDLRAFAAVERRKALDAARA